MSAALVFVIDRTYSMERFLNVLKQVMPGTLQAAALTGVFKYMGVCAYADYDSADDAGVIFSGYKRCDDAAQVAQLNQFVTAVDLVGGGDEEATKTALHRVVSEPLPEALGSVHVLHFCDQPPHPDKLSWCSSPEARCESRVLGQLYPWKALVGHMLTTVPIIFSVGSRQHTPHSHME